MNPLRILVVLLALCCVVVSCSSEIGGRATGLGPGGTSLAYRSHFDPEVRTNLEYNDEFQKLDPCGFIDPVTIAAWGPTKHFGNSQTLGDCDVRFDHPVTSKRITTVTMTTGVANVASGKQVTLPDGTVVDELADYGSCAIAVQFDGEQSFMYFVKNETNPFAPGPNDVLGVLCSDAEALVAASVPLLSTKPLRVDSTRTVLTPAASADPCAFLNEVDDIAEITSNGKFAAVGQCNAYGTPDVEDTRVEVFIIEASNHKMLFPSPDSNALQILGVAASELDYKGDDSYCTIDVFVGVDNQYPVQTYRDEESWMDTLEVTGTGCSNVRRIAQAATRQYLSR